MQGGVGRHDPGAGDAHDASGPAGPRVLLVEDDTLIGLDLETTLRRAGCKVIGPVQSFEEAVGQAGKPGFDVAVLDINLGGHSSFLVADILHDRGIPFVFLTGYDKAVVPGRHANQPFLQKPCASRKIAAMVRLAAVR